jgi:hypothetical protein
VAMDEWVAQPQGQGQSHTALDDILPCADAAVTAEALRRSKEVNYQLVSKLNQLLSNVSNGNVPPQAGPPLYYNQSGPPVPLLCSPYSADLSDRPCAVGEVTAADAQQVRTTRHGTNKEPVRALLLARCLTSRVRFGDFGRIASHRICRSGSATCAARRRGRAGKRCARRRGA